MPDLSTPAEVPCPERPRTARRIRAFARASAVLAAIALGLAPAVAEAGGSGGEPKGTDVGIEKVEGSGTTIAGESLAWILTVTNHGSRSASNVRITDVVPSQLGEIHALDPACTLSGRTVRCNLGTLAPGARREILFRTRTRPDLVRFSRVTNAASVTTDTGDTNPRNDRDEATTTIDTRADLQAKKRVDAAHVPAGGEVVYRLTVRNHGPSYARNVRLRDDVPALIEIVSTAPAGRCTVLLQLVTCNVGDLAPGASADVVIRGRAVGAAAPPGDASGGEHLIGVDRAEVALSLDAGQQRTFDVACPDGGIVTDGSLRIDAVDQGTGTKADVLVRASHVVDRSTYRVVAENAASGRAQGHAVVTCLRPRTVGGNGASHALSTDPPVTRTDTLAVGRHTVRLVAGAGRHAVAPGFETLHGRVRWAGSEPTSDGWELTFDVLEPAQVRSSIVPLHDRLGLADGHTHRLAFTHPERPVTLPPGESEHGIDCAPLEKGITASWMLPDGVVPIGEEGRPRTRNFWFWNPGDAPVAAKIDVLCVGDRTAPPDPEVEVRNTVTVSSDTVDPQPGNDQASVDVVIGPAGTPDGGAAGPGGAPGPGVGPAPGAGLAAGPGPTSSAAVTGPGPAGDVGRSVAAGPAPRDGTGTGGASGRVGAVTLASSPTFSGNGRTAAARVRCRAACSLTVELRVKGRVVARHRVSRSRAGTSTVRLRLSAAAARRARAPGTTVQIRDAISGRVVAKGALPRR